MQSIISRDQAQRSERCNLRLDSEIYHDLLETLKSIYFAALLLDGGGAIADKIDHAIKLVCMFTVDRQALSRGRPPMRVQISEVPLEDYDGRNQFGQRIPGAPQRDDDPTSRGLSDPQPRRPGELKDLLATAEKAQKQNRRAIEALIPQRDIVHEIRQAAERR